MGVIHTHFTVVVPVCLCVRGSLLYLSSFVFPFILFFFVMLPRCSSLLLLPKKKITARKYDDDLLEKILSVTSKAHKTWY